jgi:ABC-type transport system involved in cytochrome c biogenesis ATPase subunit
MYITHDYRILCDRTTQVLDIQVISNGEEIKVDEIKFVRHFNANGTVSSSVLRIVIGVANCVLGRILGTGEREAERYVTGIVC